MNTVPFFKSFLDDSTWKMQVYRLRSGSSNHYAKGAQPAAVMSHATLDNQLWGRARAHKINVNPSSKKNFTLTLGEQKL